MICAAPLTRAIQQHDLRAILNRPLPWVAEEPKCHCRDCERIRSEPFTCKHCGYTGAPYIMTCTCPERAERDLIEERQILTSLRELDPDAPYATFRGDRVVTVDERIKREEQAVQLLMDRVQAGYHKVGDEYCDGAHGHRECPVCLDGDEQVVGVSDNLLSIVRDMRVALLARGLL